MIEEGYIDKKVLEGLLLRQENFMFPTSYLDSMKRYLCIRLGDESLIPGEVKKFRDSLEYFCIGRYSPDTLENSKILFIIYSTLASRIAVEYGLDMDTSMIMSEVFVQEVLKQQNLDDVAMLFGQMLHEYTRRTNLSKFTSVGRNTRTAMEYITCRLHSKITLADIASYVGISQAQLSESFKKDLGCTVSEYIMNQKLEKAAIYLKFSEYSITEISSLLSFATQSHFTEVFRKHYGKTPKKYRNEECRLLTEMF